MRNLPAAAIGLAVFLAAPTLALAANESAKMTGQDQSQNQTQSEPSPGQSANQSIPQQVKNNLEQAGFSDIKIMPQSFLVRAKDKNGDPVMMVINPDSVVAVTEYNGANGNPAGNNTTPNNNKTGNED